MNDEEVIRWAKDKYPQYLENIELLRSLYRRQVLGESAYSSGTRRKLPFRRIKDVNEGDRAICKCIIIEKRREGVKNKKWAQVVVGDVSGMVPGMIFQDPNDPDLEEGKEYLFRVSNRGEKGYTFEPMSEPIDRNDSIAIDSVYDYVYELNGGKVNKDLFEAFVKKRGLTMEEVMRIFNFDIDGEIVVGR